MPRVAMVVHPTRPGVAGLADKTRAWWEERGYEVVDFAAGAAHEPDAIELAVSLGGDGTMLRTVELASPLGVPVLGVNLGRMGYLTEVEPAGLETAFERFAKGDYEVAERMTLEVVVAPAGDPRQSMRVGGGLLALNEAVVEKIEREHTIRLAVAIADRPFLTYEADGVILSTPTGSTAYNLSARGPIISPSLRAIVLTPISPHMLFDRSLVLDPGEWVTLTVGEPRRAALVVDGSVSLELEPGDVVTTRASETAARLVTFGRRDFHAILRGKFGLTGR